MQYTPSIDPVNRDTRFPLASMSKVIGVNLFAATSDMLQAKRGLCRGVPETVFNVHLRTALARFA